MRKLVNEKGKSLSVEESRKIQTQMENITNQRSKLTDMAYLMLFPEAEHEEWAQNLKIMDFTLFWKCRIPSGIHGRKCLISMRYVMRLVGRTCKKEED